MLDADQLHRPLRLAVGLFCRPPPSLDNLPDITWRSGADALRGLVSDWNKTVLYRLLVRRSTSAKIDVVFALFATSALSLFVEIAVTWAYPLAPPGLAMRCRLLSWRITLPSDGFSRWFSVMVYFLVFDFVGYWCIGCYHALVLAFAPVSSFSAGIELHPSLRAHRGKHSLGLRSSSLPDIPQRLRQHSATFLVVNEFVNFCEHSETAMELGLDWALDFLLPYRPSTASFDRCRTRDKEFWECPLWIMYSAHGTMGTRSHLPMGLARQTAHRTADTTSGL